MQGLSKAVREQFPFKNRFSPISGYKLHYIDEGSGPMTLFLHDFPLWSYYYRHLIRLLKPHFRCVAPDYLGFGLSDKPENRQYSLETITDDITKLLINLKAGKFNLVLHGWGGIPGMAIAERWPERINRIVLLNANCFPDISLPVEYIFYRSTGLGKFLLKAFNWPLLRAAFNMPLSSASRTAYLHPFSRSRDRHVLLTFMKNLPADTDDQVAPFYQTIVDKLPILSHKKFLAFWGTNESMFGKQTLKRWKSEFDSMKVHEIQDSDRNTLETEFETIFPLVRSFLLAGVEAKLPEL